MNDHKKLAEELHAILSKDRGTNPGHVSDAEWNDLGYESLIDELVLFVADRIEALGKSDADAMREKPTPKPGVKR